MTEPRRDPAHAARRRARPRAHALRHRLDGALGAWIARSRARSPWLVHFDCGGCNGCDIEILDALTPRHSAERFGAIVVGDPRQADVLVVSGPANRRNASVLRAVYDQMAEPRAVIGVGSCAAHGGVFRGSPNILGGIGEVVPVDVFVPGCPPPPEAVISALLDAAACLAAVRPDRAPSGGPGEISAAHGGRVRSLGEVLDAADADVPPAEVPHADPR